MVARPELLLNYLQTDIRIGRANFGVVKTGPRCDEYGVAS
jgi:hypothetical protein